ncbi:MAG: general secretion pathway protein GspB [Candidatus Omnitrophica bacterium]|nr:general secretion pathway protein GspB [Candidatus Omnitrophota bacterium]
MTGSFRALRWAVAGAAALMMPAALGLADEGRRDPFIALVNRDGRYIASVKGPATLGTGIEGVVLEGVLQDPAGAMAIINGEVVRAGDMVDGFFVKTIEPDRVILKVGEKEHTILLIREEDLQGGTRHDSQ